MVETITGDQLPSVSALSQFGSELDSAETASKIPSTIGEENSCTDVTESFKMPVESDALQVLELKVESGTQPNYLTFTQSSFSNLKPWKTGEGQNLQCFVNFRTTLFSCTKSILANLLLRSGYSYSYSPGKTGGGVSGWFEVESTMLLIKFHTGHFLHRDMNKVQ